MRILFKMTQAVRSQQNVETANFLEKIKINIFRCNCAQNIK